MKSLCWLVFISTVLACGGTATLAPSQVAVPSPTPTLFAPQATLEQDQPPTSTSIAPTATIKPDQPPLPTSIAPTATIKPDQSPTATVSAAQGPVVSIGGADFSADFPVELALTAEEQIQGLSGRPTLTANTGMLFVYQRQSRYTFWMPDMHFPLDIVWIGSDCAVADVTLNALPPAPGQANQDLPLYSPKKPAQYVLEINAGEAEAKGIKEGVGVEFLGELAGKYGC